MANAGWYNDESDPALARWYDGAGWTGHVLVKADWEGGLHGPPPPRIADPAGSRRLRAVVASAVVLAVLAVAGVALARDDGDDGPEHPTTARQPVSADGLGDGLGGVASTGVDVPAPTSGDDPAAVTPSQVRGGTSRTTRATAPPATVRRTETSTHTQTNTGPVTEVGGGDESSVGNTSNTTIVSGYVPPPPTTTTVPETTTSSPPASTVPDTTVP